MGSSFDLNLRVSLTIILIIIWIWIIISSSFYTTNTRAWYTNALPLLHSLPASTASPLGAAAATAAAAGLTQ